MIKKYVLRLSPVFVLLLLLVGLVGIGQPDLKDSYSSSTAIYSSEGKLLRFTLSEDEKYRQWTSLGEIPKKLKQIIMFKEDRHFRYHPGFNPFSLLRSFYMTFISRSGSYGGSTITMQLARIHYKMYTKSIPGKIKQMIAASFLELTHSKDEIFEAYLNLIPMGRNIEGVASSSLIYFQKNLSALNIPEMMLLAVLPQNPNLLSAHSGIGQLPEKLKNKRDLLFSKWVVSRPDDKKYESVFNLPFHIHSLDNIPFLAPHFTTELLLDRMLKGKTVIHTTLDHKLQNLVESKLKRYLERNRSRAINNAALMLVDFKKMEVLAKVGSGDFFNDDIFGQVDGTLSKRSPGSTLKPFLYALAIEQGIVIPGTTILDLPTNFVTPRNYDQDYLGPISVEEALTKSRNLPAADILRKTKYPSLYDFLRTLGISKMKPNSHYGSSLIMGSLELTMEEISGLYSILGNNGEMRPLRKLKGREWAKPIRVLTRESSIMVKDMLSRSVRPELKFSNDFIANLPEIFWKTGTSIGFRDAWTAGVMGEYVLVVWVGDFSGKGSTQYVGLETAAPLFFEIMEGLYHYKGVDKTINHGYAKNLDEIEVCSVSGKIPNKYCPHKKKSLFFTGVSPISKCETHRKIIVHKKTGLRACYKSRGDVEEKIVEFWPTQVMEFFKKNGVGRKLAPEFGKECSFSERYTLGVKPFILSPKNGVSYPAKINEGFATIPLKARFDMDVKQVYWYLGKKLLGKVGSGELFLAKVPPGKHLVKVVDDHGRADSKYLNVGIVK